MAFQRCIQQRCVMVGNFDVIIKTRSYSPIKYYRQDHSCDHPQKFPQNGVWGLSNHNFFLLTVWAKQTQTRGNVGDKLSIRLGMFLLLPWELPKFERAQKENWIFRFNNLGAPRCLRFVFSPPCLFPFPCPFLNAYWLNQVQPWKHTFLIFETIYHISSNNSRPLITRLPGIITFLKRKYLK